MFWAKAALFCLAWFLLTTALTQPMGVSERGGENQNLKQKVNEVTFLIDASASMSVADTRTHKTRLEYAKEIADLIVSLLNGDKVSLYAFTSEPVKIVPSTFNTPFLRFILEQIQINEGGYVGTDFKKVLSKVVQSKKTYILLSDGGDTQLPGGQRFKDIVSLIDDARVFTIGMGSKEPSQVPGVEYKGKPVYSAEDEELLKAISKAGQGRYYFANEMTAMEIAQDIKRLIDQLGTDKTAAVSELIEKPYFQYPLALALLCLSLFLFLPDKLKQIALFVCCVPWLHGSELGDAADYFEAKDYAQAENRYEMLLQEPLTPWQRAVVLYNLGTTEIAAGQLEKGMILLDTVPAFAALEKNLTRNEAVALFRLAKKESSPDLYLEALQGIERAKMAGNAHLQKMEDAAKAARALLLEQEPPDLLEMVNQALFNIRFLENNPLNDNLKKKYLNYIANQTSQLEQMLQDDQEAKTFVSQALSFIQAGEVSQSLEALTSAKEILSRSPAAPLDQLLKAYQRALLQQIMFPDLIKDLKAMRPDPNLDKSLKALEEGKSPLARLYLLEARQDILREKWKLAKKSALETLREAIEEERHALSLNRNKAPETLVSEAQEKAALKAEPFLAMVYREQAAQNACQKNPWDKALPYFYDGYEKAGSTSLADQEEALFDWQAAYNLINEYRPQPPEEQTNFEESLNNLQFMRQQDALPKRQKTFIPEEKPW